MTKKDKRGGLLEHNYDGIRELDNVLPPWWLYLFYFTIVISVAYILYYHVLDMGDSQAMEYQKEMEYAASQKKAIEAAAPKESAEMFNLLTDEASMTSGKNVFAANCAVCHAADGGGTIGPNMTDKYWIHGNRMEDLMLTIKQGVPAKGMISWKGMLTPLQMQEVASYILSLQGTTPAKPKAPEGQLYE